MNDQELVKKILLETKNIAVVGFSSKQEKAGYYVPEYLQDQGYRIIPVNPFLDIGLGEKAFPDLLSCPKAIDLVLIFQRSEKVLPFVEQAIQVGAKAIWMQLGIKNQPLSLLNSLRGARILNLPSAEECCGFGGVFSIEYPEISTAMLERKINHIEASSAPQVVTCDAGCMSNINGGLHRQGKTPHVLHIAEILNEALELREGGVL